MFLVKNSLEINTLLTNFCVKSILKAGILMDEDLEVVIMHYEKEDSRHEVTFSLVQSVLSGVSLASSFCVLSKNFSRWWLPFTTAPLVICSLKLWSEKLYIIRKKKIMRMIIYSIKDTIRLNRTILGYFQERSTSSVLDPFTIQMKDFLRELIKEEWNALFAFQDCIQKCCIQVPMLGLDYSYIQTAIIDIFESKCINTIEDSINALQSLSDVFLLFSSSCLCCLAVIFCYNIWTSHDVDIEEILEKILPTLQEALVSTHNNAKRHFSNLQFYYLNLKILAQGPEVQTYCSKVVKLDNSTSQLMSQMSILIEKSVKIRDEFQKYPNLSEDHKNRLHRWLAELRAQLFDCHESADVLLKQYELHLNKIMPPSIADLKVESSLSTEVLTEETQDASLFPVEPAADELYSLYIGVDDPPSSQPSYSEYEDDDNRQQAALVNQELKQKLRKNEMFSAASKRWTTESEMEREETAGNESRNKLDQRPLLMPEPKLVQADPIRVEPENHVCLPPPPPPPLMQFDFGCCGDQIESSTVDFLGTIKQASKQHIQGEEVFGDSDFEND